MTVAIPFPHVLMIYLVETNIVGIFTEALTANVQVVLADQGSSVSTDTAVMGMLVIRVQVE